MSNFASCKISGKRLRDSSIPAVRSVTEVVVKATSVEKDLACDTEVNPQQMARGIMALKVLIKGI